ncbi:methyl-accepting chemotaxis protein [Pelomonas sp. CA6]|uniref:methyl-accepting chemotaxis protein n=1 Tax=Pelomonas sp. CA6 TaxID=2907999 RepID=UPI001F4C3910|nr:methyl-accepting chemotaxis protein [Pelomonas sp. CA6]MCH7344327.1 methyl-accepting chemotaxis protein [Pelomonas sp. CA6]
MHLNLKQRLGLVALLCALLSLIPATQLGLGMRAQLSSLSGERAALPAHEAWQALLARLADHRIAAASSKPDAVQQRDQAAQAVQRQLAALPPLLAQAGLPAERQQALRQLGERFESLQARLGQGPLPLPELLLQHREIARLLLEELGRLNAASGLLLDPDPATHFAMVAGLQLAPRLTDTLADLSAIAQAAAVDDIAAVSSAAARYRADSEALMANLALAAQLAPDTQGSQAATRQAIQQQRDTVLQALEASARDVNYPLEQLTAAFARAAQLQTQLSRHAGDALEKLLGERAATLQQRAAWTLGLLLAGLVLVAAMLWRALAGIWEPVQAAIATTERIAQGDLSVHIPVHGRDELGRVLQAIAGMRDRLRELVTQLQSASGEIHRAADEIAAGHQDLNHRSEAAAMRVQAVANTVQQLARTVADTAQAAGRARQGVLGVSEASRESSERVQQFLATMEAIHGSARQMADIVSVIDGIAFQTNILALNAAVEAARAGEQGRGFAVVAAEVRGLAQRSAQAAREVKALIHQAVSRVETGTAHVGEAGSAIHAVNERIATVRSGVEGIAEDAHAESTRMEALRDSLDEIDEMARQNAALVEQAAAAAASLNRQAEQMTSLAGRFRLQPGA